MSLIHCITSVYSRFVSTIVLAVGLLAPIPGQAQPTLVWSDEFDSPGLPDPTKWNYDVGGGGWGNQELQFYTRDRLENARVENGVLIIEARKEASPSANAFGGGKRDYTSARLVTKSKGDWQYGRFEIRAKLPAGRGTWPAIWMLPTGWAYGGWPRSGEIDIMEHVGYNMQVIHASTHTEDFNFRNRNNATASILASNVDTEFHTYVLEWRPDRIDAFLDDELYFTASNNGTGPKAWPFEQPFHLILNIAVGGSWGAVEGVDPDIWPQRMEVDYVRVYNLGDSPVLDADGDTIIDELDPDDDNDGLSDINEFQYRTNPFLTDSDGDGFTDGEEVYAGSNPTYQRVTPEAPLSLLYNTDFSNGYDRWSLGTLVFSSTGEPAGSESSGVSEDDLSVTPEGTATFSAMGLRSGAAAKEIFQDTSVGRGLEPGDSVTFRGTASSTGTASTEAFILVYDFESEALPMSVSVPINPDGGEFSLTTTLEMGDVNGLSLGFRIKAEAGTSGTITFSDLSSSLTKPARFADWISADGNWVDTGDWLGWLAIPDAPWIWSLQLSTWLYLPETAISPSGAWVYVRAN